ncbi:MAG: AbiV family abortive infection protein [Bacteroidetes bacterium]|nr:AbiV family abortive infection protein [Bacteroidota bacterium]
MKKERNLLKLLSDEECYSASMEAFETARIHKEAAETIAKTRHYGIPVSHLILSTEQLVVGVILYLQHLRLDVRNVEGVHLFFTDHVIKHRAATYINFLYPILKLLMGVIIKEKEKIYNPETIVEYSEEEKAFMSKDEEKIKTIFNDLSEMFDWWEDANMKKNQGLYVDYSDRLETPMQITEGEYKQALVISLNFEKQITEIISHFESASTEDKDDIYKNRKSYKIDEILKSIIEARKKEIRDKKGKDKIL